MSLVERLVIGWFDAREAAENRYRVPTPLRPLTAAEVEELRVVCAHVFGSRLRLADYLQEKEGVLVFGSWMTPEKYAIACVAHDVFGMSAVDVNHCAIYPEEDGEMDELLDGIRRGGDEGFLRLMTIMSDRKRQIRRRLRHFTSTGVLDGAWADGGWVPPETLAAVTKARDEAFRSGGALGGPP